MEYNYQGVEHISEFTNLKGTKNDNKHNKVTCSMTKF